MTFQDETRTCVECGESYLWSERDQKFGFEKGFLPPKRCPRCRAARKQRQYAREQVQPEQ
jgi:ssDNA-binding Zn-finger/Zn-ribbon topoisomerase 1